MQEIVYSDFYRTIVPAEIIQEKKHKSLMEMIHYWCNE
jgi:hypothetical protein